MDLHTRYKKEPLPTPEKGIDRGSWFVFRAFKQVPKSTLISALKKKLRREYNHLGWSIIVALRLAMLTLSRCSVAERSAVLQHTCFGTGNSANAPAGVSGSAFAVLATDNSSRSQR